jgi:hypothetical protein
MPNQTPEQAARAQAQMEDFARLAYNVKRAVDALEDAFCGLSDWPEGIGETMPKLAAAANLAADWSCDWAQLGNCEFDPSIPRSSPQQ